MEKKKHKKHMSPIFDESGILTGSLELVLLPNNTHLNFIVGGDFKQRVITSKYKRRLLTKLFEHISSNIEELFPQWTAKICGQRSSLINVSEPKINGILDLNKNQPFTVEEGLSVFCLNLN